MANERQYKDPPHRRKYKAAACKRLRDFYRSNGICYQCGQNYAEPGHVLCANCATDSKRRTKKRDPDGTKHKDYNKKTREQRKQAGLCVDCGKRRPKIGFLRCEACLRKAKERCQVYRIRKRLKKQNKQQ